MSSKGSASLVRNDHLTGQQQQQQEASSSSSVTMQQPNKGKVRPSSRQQLDDVTTLIKRNKERRCHQHYVTWPLLLAVAAACVALVTCHLWFTWHLQRKVEALQSRVQSLASTRDLDELRAQLRNLHDNLVVVDDDDDDDAGAQFNKDSMLERHVFNGENNQSLLGSIQKSEESLLAAPNGPMPIDYIWGPSAKAQRRALKCEREEEEEVGPETDQPGEIVDLSLAADGDKSSAALLLSGLDQDDDDEEEEEEKKDIRVFSSIHTPAERNEMLEVDWQRRTANSSSSSSSKRVSKMDRLDGRPAQTNRNRNKRQADLSSHTQDGVPIFDRGYGATPPNRTEGLRIYQSLLTNSGRNEPGQSRSAESDAAAAVVQQQQPHNHRQNNFWRNRNKEKPRHRHQKATTRSPLLVDDVELSSVAAEFEANGQDLRSPSDTTSPPAAAAKSSVAPSNVEFRHSRVKTSSENTGPLSVDQKIWSRSNGIFSIGTGPYASGGSLQEDRISAATAPAILTKTVTASVGSSSSQVRQQQQQQQPNVYKVNQPAVNARGGSSSSQQSDNEDQISRDSPSSPSSSGKKRINKKQLRDLSHTATAVHLVADTRNATSTSYENQGIDPGTLLRGAITKVHVAIDSLGFRQRCAPKNQFDLAIPRKKLLCYTDGEEKEWDAAASSVLISF
ncbi:hypothetical protein DAPPUDRAFT_98210 [Daphnia pulex]|uniref:Uncharacterized protein n=1 Tax=Daphnia pulex TaxID=6669 RepID=E9G442_DAPPU|nr:hypothetical protein DAPPUDRAFT_98210 [Daphnia pulex]|eukprot:EFX85684.1 hypothetical protein DAPPUDRAFT_98210 [Daphnia pulex]